MLDPQTSAAVISHYKVSEHMNNPRNIVRKSMLLGTIGALGDVRFWRPKMRAICGMTEAEAEAIREKAVMLQRIETACPFFR